MKRLLVALLLGSCGGRSDAGMFEQAVIDANMELDRCWTGEYRPRDEFPYSETAALSACRSCWMERQANRVLCSTEADDACDDVLWFDRCACIWRTSAVSEEDCRACLLDACGVEAIDGDSATCATEHCQTPDTCTFSAECALR